MNKKLNTIIFLILGVITFFPSCLIAQSASLKKAPMWVEGYFQDLTYSYVEMVYAEGANLEEARNKAAQTVIERRNMTTGQHVTVTVENGNVRVDGSDELKVKSRIIDEYVVCPYPGTYKVYLLMQTAKNPAYDYETVTVTNKYPFSGTAFVPGMAQIKKGTKGKGVAFIVSEVVFVGGIVTTECLRSSYVAKMNGTHTTSLKKQYIQNADICANARNISIALAASVYVWNVIDGIVAKGKKQVLVNGKSLTFAPYFENDNYGISLNYKF